MNNKNYSVSRGLKGARGTELQEIRNYGNNNLEETNKKEEEEDIQVVLSRPVRLMIFFLFILKEILVDIDAGIIASNSAKIKITLRANDSRYGLFASIPFTGRFVGAFIFIFLFNNDHRKLWLVSSSILHGALLCTYLISSNFFILIFVRVLTAIVKSFSTIYLPIWIDQFGIRQYKTILLTILHMTNPYGNVIGFSLGSLFFDDWRVGLCWAGIAISSVGFLFLLFPQKYFSANYMFIGYEQGEKLVHTRREKRKRNIAFRKESVFSDYTQSSKPADPFLNSEGKSEKSSELEESTFQNGLSLMRNEAFLTCSFSRSVLFFVLQIIHLFFKEYTTVVLKVKNEDKIVFYYSFLSIAAPALGSLIGGIFSNSLGGYESQKSSIIIIIFNLLAGMAILILANTLNFNFFVFGIFLFFFSVSAILPTITGYTLLSVPKKMKSLSSSLDLLITTLLGKLPGPILYGFISDYWGSENKGFSWKICMLYYFVGFIALLLSIKFVAPMIEERKKVEKEIKKVFPIVKIIKRTSRFMSDCGLADRVDLYKIGKPLPEKY